MSSYTENHPAYQYAVRVVSNEIIAGKYIKKTCQKFLDEYNDETSKYFIDEKDLKKITNLTKLINMASGLKAGTPTHDSLAGFQWFFIVNALCWKYKDDPIKRRFEKSVLLIARKSGKSFLVALIFLILLLIEPEFSEFYSVAPDKELSSIVKKEVEQAIAVSPAISKYFQVTNKEIRCTLTKSKFIPLATSDNRMDGRKANVFVADEVGALKNRNPIDAMQSSQMNMVNRTGILISTAYESLHNPMTEEVEYSKKVLDDLTEDSSLFSMLYMPDDTKDWLSDRSLFEANPLCEELPDNTTYLKKQRAIAMELPSAKKNFLTKHMNIFVDGDDSEVYITTDDLRKCKIDDYDWTGREVYVGVDLSQTTDNTAISMVTFDVDKNEYVSQAWAFIPEDSIDMKSKIEKVDYRLMRENGYLFSCGDRVISHRYVEDFVLSLEKKYGVIIKGIGYDRYNCIASANRWYENGYETIEIRQHSSVLHPATKLLKERVLKESFRYIKNSFLEINFSNAREVQDTNLNTYVNKKKSTGKIDMVVSILNALVLWNKDVEEGLVSVYEERDIIVL
ncbi:terminase large subunit [Staphylococcus equorum]|uniref:Terminase large subunit n=1 Tax=Staphylococcus equorum TaxID=246432 RepID=A0A9X4LC11_9STAP|nr:terminase TerL endonuclease subunit [Staphylococcus equorum]MDG0860316.1 terminase large subunit [Staphylococcus equorum]